jgi:Ankyrin repeats (3 copies)
MFLLQKVFLFSLLALFFQQATTDPKQALNDQLFEAVRKGDVAAVTAALDKGADVNAKFRYGATALFKAAERGNAEVTKVLLDRGADVKVKDTFYQVTAMSWALNGKHVAVVRLLLEKSADEVEDVLLNGTREGNEELVKLALDRGGAKPETLTVALATASADEKKANITEMLKKAGAQPPLQVDAATLQSYVGKYKGDTGPEVTFTVKDGKLFVAGFGRELQPLLAKDNTTFRPVNFGGITLTFNVEAGKVASMTFKQGQTTNVMKRIADVSQ